MTTDTSLSRYAEWFIPIKLDVGSGEWQEFRREYKNEGRAGIPILFVVRADGKKLYGDVGSLPGEKLHHMLSATAMESGKLLSAKQLAVVEKAVLASERALEANDVKKALRALGRLKRIGPLGQLGSFDQHSIRADSLAQQIASDAIAESQAAADQLKAGQSPFESGCRFVELQSTYRTFGPVQESLAVISKQLSRDAATKNTLSTCREVTGAFERLSERSKQRPSLERLATIEKQAAEGELSQLIAGRLAAETLHWASRSGHSTKARFLRLSEQKELFLVTDEKELPPIELAKLDEDSQAIALLVKELTGSRLSLRESSQK